MEILLEKFWKKNVFFHHFFKQFLKNFPNIGDFWKSFRKFLKKGLKRYTFFPKIKKSLKKGLKKSGSLQKSQKSLKKGEMLKQNFLTKLYRQIVRKYIEVVPLKWAQLSRVFLEKHAENRP